MSEESSISVSRLIVHILDVNVNMPVISSVEHPTDSEIDEFIGKHILKAFKDDNLKTAWFVDGQNRIRDICTEILYGETRFVELSQEVASILFEIMQKNVDIPSADIVCCVFEFDGVKYLGILKFNYRPSYIHYVYSSQEGNVNSIVKQKTSLPGENQKPDECALINLQDLSIRLLEKKYDINGEKAFYFSDIFLKCSCEASNKQKVKMFKKATEDFNKKYFDEDFAKTVEITRAVADSIEQNEAIDITLVAETVFRQNPEMKKSYIEHIEHSGLNDRTITVDEELADKSFKKQKIKTDTGIEISVPVEYYKDGQNIEFINNIDGTISILIKNVGKITGG